MFQRCSFRSSRARQGSIAMFIVVFLTILATIPLGLQLLQASNRKASTQIHGTLQADNVARAGLVDAISWFRRQPAQPVRSTLNVSLYPYPDAVFYPRASSNDTIDESIGLVKEYPLNDAGTLWARYEIRRQKDPSTNPIDPQAAHDISDRRVQGAAAGQGLAWYIESRGLIYRRHDPSKAYNAAPNQVVGVARAATELRRITISIPSAALIVNDRSIVDIQDNARLNGGSAAGLGYYTGGWGPSIGGSGAQVIGTPTSIYDIDTSTANGSVDFQSIFGVSQAELKLMADYAISSPAELPAAYPAMAIVYLNGDATFNAARRLRGGGILFVNGNLTIESDANALFSGVIYVTGNCVVHGPALISGSIVALGSVTMNGSGDVAEVDYDASILSSIRQQVTQYRENRSAFYTFSSTKR